MKTRSELLDLVGLTVDGHHVKKCTMERLGGIFWQFGYVIRLYDSCIGLPYIFQVWWSRDGESFERLAYDSWISRLLRSRRQETFPELL